MGWMLLIVFQYSVFSIVVDDFATCEAARQLNRAYWMESGIRPLSMCVKTFRV